MEPVAFRQGEDGGGSALAGAHRALWKLSRVATPFLLRSDNGLVFTSRSYTALVRSYGLRQEFITPHTPEAERLGGTRHPNLEGAVRAGVVSKPCSASRVIGDWISFYNNGRPHQALSMGHRRQRSP
jgi:putative transposase